MGTTFNTIMYAFHVIIHPFDGFWELKHYKKKTFSAAMVILALLILVTVLRVRYTAFIFQTARPEDVNIIFRITALLIPLASWTVINWAVSTLMDGKGTMKQILVQTIYSFFPMALVYVPQMILSHVLTQQEGAVYHLFNTIALIWCIGLLLLGNMTIHEYTVSKTIAVAFLTVFGFIGVCFLTMVFFSTIQQLFVFIATIYSELKYAV